MSDNTVESTPMTTCRECYNRIPANAASCPDCGTKQKSEAVPTIFVILLLATSLLLMSSTYVTTKQVAEVDTSAISVPAVPSAPAEPPVPKDLSQAAYEAAKRFTKEKFPGAQRISALNESAVGKVGELFQVTLFVDADAGGRLVRNVVQVKLQFDHSKWILKEITQ